MAQDRNPSGWRRWRRPPLAVVLSVLLVLLLVLLAGLLVATHRPSPGVASGGDPTQRSWTLTRLVVAGSEQPLVPGHAPTMSFDRGTGHVDGEIACNSYMGRYTLAGETLHFSGLFFTDVMCFPWALMQEDFAYSDALQRVARDHLQGNTLLLTSANGRVQLTFQVISIPPKSSSFVDLLRPPLEQRGGADAVALLLERGAAGKLRVFQVLDGGEVLID